MSEQELPLKEFIAAKGVLINQGRVLFLRESGSYSEGVNAGKYDVAGGRLNPAETWIEGLKREIFEETGLHFQDAAPFYVDDWFVKRESQRWHIHGVFFVIPVDTDAVRLSSEHDHYVWEEPDKIASKLPLMRGYEQLMTALVQRCPQFFCETENQKKTA